MPALILIQKPLKTKRVCRTERERRITHLLCTVICTKANTILTCFRWRPGHRTDTSDNRKITLQEINGRAFFRTRPVDTSTAERNESEYSYLLSSRKTPLLTTGAVGDQPAKPPAASRIIDRLDYRRPKIRKKQ